MLQLVDLCLQTLALDVDLRNGIIEALAPRAQLLILTRHLVQACAELSGEALAALDRVVQLGLELNDACGAARSRNATIKGGLHIVEESHFGPS